MKEITVLLLDQMFSSTAIGPMEVFRHAGSLWGQLTGASLEPRFRVTTASADGKAVDCDGGIQIKPNISISDVAKTDLIFVPTTGLSLDDVVERNAAIVPWLKRRSRRGVAVASVCSGVGLVAAAGLLDGKRATTHWGLAERFRQKYPRVKWMPELMVTEDRGFYCGGGVNASLDLSIYLVERFCGREVAVDRDAARLAIGVRDRAAEDGSHRRLDFERAGMDAQEFCDNVPAGRSGAPRRHERPEFRPALQASDWGQPAGILTEATDRRCQANAGKQPSHDAGNQRRRGLPRHRLFPLPVSETHRSIAERVSRSLWHNFIVKSVANASCAAGAGETIRALLFPTESCDIFLSAPHRAPQGNVECGRGESRESDCLSRVWAPGCPPLRRGRQADTGRWRSSAANSR